MDLTELSATELRDRVSSGAVDPCAAVERALSRIEELDSELGAFIDVDRSGARKAAEAVRRKVRRGHTQGALLGVPVAVKDNQCTLRGRTTAGSRSLENYRAPYECTAVSRITAQGGIILGKTNLDEFGMGSSNEHSAFGPTRNPVDPSRVPGGSSGGSAAAVKARMVWGATGSDTGGSIRCPSAACGVVGLRPTYGRISRYGLIAFASSMDQIGPITRTVGDAAAFFGAMAGFDPHDATSSNRPVPDATEGLERGVAGLRLALPADFSGEVLDPEVEGQLLRSLDVLRGGGAEIVRCALPDRDLALAAYYIISCAEASSNLSRFDGVRFGLRLEGGDARETSTRSRTAGFGPEVKRRILLGSFVLSSGYAESFHGKATAVRAQIRREYLDLFDSGIDAVLGPTSPAPAFNIGERVHDPLKMYRYDAFTVSASLAGLPAVSIPSGVTSKGLPVGMQITGGPFSEPLVLRIARAVEKGRGQAGNNSAGDA
ncbi:MAG: Asp-tRNA(Asn)/Glu-tRNA(Gln) amidotransferase subunit GatA [Planctomycetota bacterium]|jgi:aspartyl-tRNA(Asn)/glutamyl-tRNA(Gln) amidotransferase subunit A